MDYDTMLVVGEPALRTSTTGDTTTFHLHDLAQHCPQAIEHDGSMSRADAYAGNPNDFCPSAWARTLRNWGEAAKIDIPTAGRELAERFAYSSKHNPEFDASFARQGSLLQYALLMSAFGDYSALDKGLVRYLFEKERLPLELGWQPTNKLRYQISLAIALKIGATLGGSPVSDGSLPERAVALTRLEATRV
ncbi:Chitin synthase 4 [Sphaceloma murrayae]|uniref:Chitin synthase 4 n=1 Tax=Sphaceloma murrayae TaxID=2082308 RepID=A0A2K1QYI7_9PEZI|nr:Chitin synthase 4 [Sphaceloma murrayae]